MGTIVNNRPCYKANTALHRLATSACRPACRAHGAGILSPYCVYVCFAVGLFLSSGFWGIWRVGLPGGLLAYPRLAFVQHTSFRLVVAHYPATGVHVVGTRQVCSFLVWCMLSQAREQAL